MILGLRTVIYYVPDVNEAKAWYAKAFGIQPYFDEPFYVGFNVGGYELGLHPTGPATVKPGAAGSVTYWGTQNVDQAIQHFVQCGATPKDAVQDVGEGIKVGSVIDPFGNVIGLIENPHFKLPAA